MDELNPSGVLLWDSERIDPHSRLRLWLPDIVAFSRGSGNGSSRPLQPLLVVVCRIGRLCQSLSPNPVDIPQPFFEPNCELVRAVRQHQCTARLAIPTSWLVREPPHDGANVYKEIPYRRFPHRGIAH